MMHLLAAQGTRQESIDSLVTTHRHHDVQHEYGHFSPSVRNPHYLTV
jgi:hypothetical protein